MAKRISVLDVISGKSPNKEAEMAASKKAGKKNFTWQDRSYNTKSK